SVRDEDDPGSLFSESADRLEQRGHFARVQCLSRFVQNQHVTVVLPAVQGTRDPDHRTLGRVEPFRRSSEIECGSEALEQLLGPFALAMGTRPKPPPPAVSPGDVYVLYGVQITREPEVLMDDVQLCRLTRRFMGKNDVPLVC